MTMDFLLTGVGLTFEWENLPFTIPAIFHSVLTITHRLKPIVHLQVDHNDSVQDIYNAVQDVMSSTTPFELYCEGRPLHTFDSLFNINEVHIVGDEKVAFMVKKIRTTNGPEETPRRKVCDKTNPNITLRSLVTVVAVKDVYVAVDPKGTSLYRRNIKPAVERSYKSHRKKQDSRMLAKQVPTKPVTEANHKERFHITWKCCDLEGQQTVEMKKSNRTFRSPAFFSLCMANKENIISDLWTNLAAITISKCSDSNCFCEGKMYHCPFCTCDCFFPTYKSKVWKHIKLSHWKSGIQLKGGRLLRCAQDIAYCREGTFVKRKRKACHYHCPYCNKLYQTKTHMIRHINSNICKLKEDVAEPQNSSTCSSTIDLLDNDFDDIVSSVSSETPTDSNLYCTGSNDNPATFYNENKTCRNSEEEADDCLNIPCDIELSSSPEIQTTRTEYAYKGKSMKNMQSHAEDQPNLVDVDNRCNIKRHASPSINNDDMLDQPSMKRTKKSIVTKTVVCNLCNKTMLSTSLSRHLSEKHEQRLSKYSVTCVDPMDAVFMVSKTADGIQYPIHVQNKNFGLCMSIKCEEELCMVAKTMSHEAGNVSWLCEHVTSTQKYNHKEYIEVQLLDENLDEMVRKKIFSEEKKNMCKELRSSCGYHPMIIQHVLKEGSSNRYKYFSVFSSKQTYYSKFGRIVISYDNNDSTLNSKCCNKKPFCVHKCVVLWYLFQEYGLDMSYISEGNDGKATDTVHITDKKGRLLYPPTGQALLDLIEYIFDEKRTIPYKMDQCYTGQCKTSIKPTETVCHKCHSDLACNLITKEGKILTTTGCISGIHIYVKVCHNCEQYYRYQESSDGLLNYDDKHLLAFNLCGFLRSGLKNNIALGRLVKTLKDTIDCETILPPDSVYINGYLMYEALSDRTFQFSCNLCGFRPNVLIFDLCKKTAFDFAVSDIPEPSDDIGDNDCEVDMNSFWTQVEKGIIANGLISGTANPFRIKPSYDFWSPWIGKHTRGLKTYNTEVKKHPVFHQDITCLDGIDGDRLTELMSNASKSVVENIARSAGISKCKTMSKRDIIVEINKHLQNDAVYNKIFQKIPGASGGYAIGICQHGVVYSMKHVLRAEGARDYGDMLQSFSFKPKITIIDFAHVLAKHMNNRVPNYFHPHNGRVYEANSANINAAKNKTLEPLEVDLQTCDATFCLFDKFHETNTSKEEEILRRTKFLQGISINTQVQEQFFAQQTRKNYFLNYMNPTKHMFLMRALFDDWNIKICQRNMKEIEHRLQQQAYVDINGVLSIGKEPLLQKTQSKQNDAKCSSFPSEKVKTTPNYDTCTTGPKNKNVKKPDKSPFSKMSPKTEPKTNTKRKKHTVHVSGENVSESLNPSMSQGSHYEKTRQQNQTAKSSQSVDTAETILKAIKLQTNIQSDSGRKKTYIHDIATELVTQTVQFDTTAMQNLIQNLKYVQSVLGNNLESDEIAFNIYSEILGDHIFFQKQGNWPVCGVCVLNNSVQSDLFSFPFLCQTADDLWTMQIIEQGVPLTDDIQRQRGAYGDFSFDVLCEAAKRKELELINLRASVFRYPFSSDADLKGNIIDHFGTHGVLPSFVIKPGLCEHYISIIYKNNAFYLLDSAKDHTQKKTMEDVINYIRSELRHTMSGIYGIQNLNDTHNGSDINLKLHLDVSDVESDARSNDSEQTIIVSDRNSPEIIDIDRKSQNTEPLYPIISFRTIHGGTLEIYDTHLQCLKKNEYINNFIIDFVCEEIMLKNKSIYATETILSACLTDKKQFNIEKHRFESCGICLIPIHLAEQKHWILFILDKNAKTWSLFDPLWSKEQHYEDIILSMRRIIPELKDYKCDQRDMFKSLKQSDGSSCGLHIILLMLWFSCKQDCSIDVPSSDTWANNIYKLRDGIKQYILAFNMTDENRDIRRITSFFHKYKLRIKLCKTEKYKRSSWQSELFFSKAETACLCSFDKQIGTMTEEEYIRDQQETISTYLTSILRCTIDVPLHYEACFLFDMINSRLCRGRIPKADKVLRWTSSEEFRSDVLAKTFVSDYRKSPLVIFNIVISSNLVTENQTLCKVLFHEVVHCVQHLDGKSDVSHGSYFKLKVKHIMKNLQSKINKDVVHYLTSIGCNVSTLQNDILMDL